MDELLNLAFNDCVIRRNVTGDSEKVWPLIPRA